MRPQHEAWQRRLSRIAKPLARYFGVAQAGTGNLVRWINEVLSPDLFIRVSRLAKSSAASNGSAD